MLSNQQSWMHNTVSISYYWSQNCLCWAHSHSHPMVGCRMPCTPLRVRTPSPPCFPIQAGCDGGCRQDLVILVDSNFRHNNQQKMMHVQQEQTSVNVEQQHLLAGSQLNGSGILWWRLTVAHMRTGLHIAYMHACHRTINCYGSWQLARQIRTIKSCSFASIKMINTICCIIKICFCNINASSLFLQIIEL